MEEYLVRKGTLEQMLPCQLLPCEGSIQASLRLCHERDRLSFRFVVREPVLKRMCCHHNDQVFEDSHVGMCLAGMHDDASLTLGFSAAGWAMGILRRDGGVSLVEETLLAGIPRKLEILENHLGGCKWSLTGSLDLAQWELVTSADAPFALRGNFVAEGLLLFEPAVPRHFENPSGWGVLRFE